MTTFQRARSAEQREERRRAILDTAATMLTEMPVADLSLNNLSRRVCLAKSNVLRYFDSREAVLLELLDGHWQSWLTELADDGPADVNTDADAAPDDRIDALAAAMAGSLAGRPVFCDLLASQAAVLERNVSAQVAAEFKRTAVRRVSELALLARRHVPELDAADAFRFAGATVMTAGGLWAHTQPGPGMLEAYRSDPELADLRLDFIVTLQDLLTVLLAGLLARAAR